MIFNLEVEGEAAVLKVVHTEAGGLEITSPQGRYDVTCRRINDYHLYLTIDGVGVNAFVSGDSEAKQIMINGVTYQVADADARTRHSASGAATHAIPREVTPPMPSVVVKILVTEGQRVRQGEGLIVVSAMKMETSLAAPFDARVVRINTAVGDKVMPGDTLVDLAAEAEEA